MLAGNWRPTLGTRLRLRPLLHPGRARSACSRSRPARTARPPGPATAMSRPEPEHDAGSGTVGGGTLDPMAQDGDPDESQEADRHDPEPRRPDPGADRATTSRCSAPGSASIPSTRWSSWSRWRRNTGSASPSHEVDKQRVRIAGQPGRVRGAPAGRVEAANPLMASEACDRRRAVITGLGAVSAWGWGVPALRAGPEVRPHRHRAVPALRPHASPHARGGRGAGGPSAGLRARPPLAAAQPRRPLRGLRRARGRSPRPAWRDRSTSARPASTSPAAPAACWRASATSRSWCGRARVPPLGLMSSQQINGPGDAVARDLRRHRPRA